MHPLSGGHHPYQVHGYCDEYFPTGERVLQRAAAVFPLSANEFFAQRVQIGFGENETVLGMNFKRNWNGRNKQIGLGTVLIAGF